MKREADVRYVISMYDLANLDVCKGGGCSNLSTGQLEQVLFDNGLDVRKPYSYCVGEHRPKSSNQIVNSGYFEGFERCDDVWMKSGAASIEVVIETADPAVQQELRELMNVARTNKFKK